MLVVVESTEETQQQFIERRMAASVAVESVAALNIFRSPPLSWCQQPTERLETLLDTLCMVSNAANLGMHVNALNGTGIVPRMHLL